MGRGEGEVGGGRGGGRRFIVGSRPVGGQFVRVGILDRREGGGGGDIGRGWVGGGGIKTEDREGGKGMG